MSQESGIIRNCILIIDDDVINREVLKNILSGAFQFKEAENGLEGLRMVEQYPDAFCAILLDVQMPEMNGMELLKILHDRDITSRIPIFLITAREELDLAQSAYALGVQGVINKPVVPFIVERRIQLVVELFRARESLGERVRSQEQKLQENTETIDALHRNTLEAMASAIEFRDVESGEHTNRIYDVTKMILSNTQMGEGFSAEEIENMAIGSIMHDVGKIAISDMILNKPGKLTKDEFEIMKLHTVKGSELMERLRRMQDHPSYLYALDIARHHHERWDGKGYPDGLKGDEITPWAQVVSIADVYDALVSPRIYKKALSPEEAVEMICSNQCGVFAPKLLQCFLQIEPQLRTLYQNDDHSRISPEPEPAEQPCQPASPAERDTMDMILLTAAVRQFYDMIICANLTANTFYILDDERFKTHCSSKEGVFDDLIRDGAASIPASHRQAFLDHFSRERLLQAFAEGRRSVDLDHPQYTDDGTVMQVSTNVLLVEDPRNNNVRNITLIRYAGGGQPL